MNNFYVGESIPLTFRLLVGGVAQTGQTVTVAVYDETTGATVLASTTCPEVVAGQYTYNWTSPPKYRSNLRVTFTTGGKAYDTYYQINDEYFEAMAN